MTVDRAAEIVRSRVFSTVGEYVEALQIWEAYRRGRAIARERAVLRRVL